MALTTLKPGGKSTVWSGVRLMADCCAIAETMTTGATAAAMMSDFLSTGSSLETIEHRHRGTHAAAGMIVWPDCNAQPARCFIVYIPAILLICAAVPHPTSPPTI